MGCFEHTRFYRKYTFFFAICLLTLTSVYAQTPGTNYLRERFPRIAVRDSLVLDTIPIKRQAVSISYSDGLSRPLQDIQLGGSPLQNDIVGPHLYDNMGRETTSYLPYIDQASSGYFRNNAIQNVVNFYNPSAPGAIKIPTDASPYSQVSIEPSPLARTQEEGNLGYDYGLGTGHTVRHSYQVNSTADRNIGYWVIQGNSVSVKSNYATGTLTQNIVTDENGHRYETWKDFQGRVVSRAQLDAPNANYVSSYVYNDLSQLAYIVTPGATRELAKKGVNQFSESAGDPIFTEHIYAYHYDSVGRLVEKKIPGKGWQYLVYNVKDQVVLSQDSNLRAKAQWSFFKYDALGRIVQTGIYVNVTQTTRDQNQKSCDQNPVLWETWNQGSGYTNNAFPKQGLSSKGTVPLSIYTKSYYDDYTFPEAATKAYRKNTLDTGYSKRTQGLLTGESVLVLGTAGQYLSTVNYYDSEDRLIQQQSDNHLGQVDTVTNQYDFVGELIKSRIITKVSATNSVTQQDRYRYDHIGRLTDTWESVQNKPEVHLSTLTYNELGQVVTKGLNVINTLPDTITESTTLSTSKADTALKTVILNPGFSFTASATASYSAVIAPVVVTKNSQTVDYRYTIRGQLKSINNASLTYDGGITQTDRSALFGAEINYGEATGLKGRPQYNGNISSIAWRNKIEASGQTGVTTGTQGYTLGYDNIDRQTTSKYYQLSGTTWTASPTDAFSENVSSYDEMGNMTGLARKDKSGTVINNLTYQYLAGGNKLAGVTDAGTEGITSTYTYDGNGNMTADSKKGITITYNYLDLPDTVRQGSSKLVYTYDASGTKLYKQLITNGAVTSQRHYVDGVEETATSSLAVDGKIEFITMPEGRLINTGGGNYQNEYFLADHLGNLRVTFRVNAGGVLSLSQVQNYYPFGRDMGDATMNFSSTPQNGYKYSGKEQQPELGLMDYDFGARHYDARIARWEALDPLAEDYEDLSPYNYVANSPLNNYDPDGAFTLPAGISCPGECGGGGIGPYAEVVGALAYGFKDLLGGQADIALDPRYSIKRQPTNVGAQTSGGEKENPNDIIIKGTKSFTEKALTDLQKLTSRILTLFPDGRVVENNDLISPQTSKTQPGLIPRTNMIAPKPNGTRLISDLINNKAITSIIESTDGRNHTLDEGGSNAAILYSPQNNGNTIINSDGTRGRKPEVGLGHELLHVKNIVSKTQDTRILRALDPDNQYKEPTWSPFDREEIRIRFQENRIRGEQNAPDRAQPILIK